MTDPTEEIRRTLVPHINQLEDPEIPAPTWTTAELSQDFEVHSFAAPFVIVTLKATGQRGTLMFRHAPRLYWGWSPDHVE